MDITSATKLLIETKPLVAGTTRRLGPWNHNGNAPPAVGTVIRHTSGKPHSTVVSLEDFHGFALCVAALAV